MQDVVKLCNSGNAIINGGVATSAMMTGNHNTLVSLVINTSTTITDVNAEYLKNRFKVN